VRLRRKSDTTSETLDGLGEEVEEGVQIFGPFDSGDVELEDFEGIDLGSLRIIPPDGTELRLQVDEQTGEVIAVVIVGENGALELRAFASPREGDIWSDARREIAADTTQRGGTATETEGAFGPELKCMMPLPTEDGQSVIQPSRVIGITGPRWLLRCSLMGLPATDGALGVMWEDTIRGIVVHRGSEAMAPGEPLPLHLPPEAKRVDG
jgi:hypothetical protein